MSNDKCCHCGEPMTEHHYGPRDGCADLPCCSDACAASLDHISYIGSDGSDLQSAGHAEEDPERFDGLS